MNSCLEADQEQLSSEARRSKFQRARCSRTIAKPRLTGSRRSRSNRRNHAATSRSLGYEVRERTSSFPPGPGRFGVTLAGVFYLVGALVSAGFLLSTVIQASRWWCCSR